MTMHTKAAILLLCLGAVSAHAQDPVRHAVKIDAQPIGAALKELAAQTGLQVVVFSQDARDKRSAAVQGNLTKEEALTQILRDSGLTYEKIDANTVAIKPKSAGPAADVTAEAPVSLRLARGDQAGREDGSEEEPQASKEPVGEIVVTGTNIKGVAPAGSPVIVIDEETIRRSGYTSTEQLLQSLPQNVRAGKEGATADSALTGGSLAGLNSTKGSGVNLRGLGSVATLTLINGRRIAASAAGSFTDVSLIPINAIESIEVLTDGASAIYGADAVAGVVNFILKKDYEGSESQARYGFTTEEGRDELHLTHTLGSSWDGGSALVVLDYLNQSELGVDERPGIASVATPTSIFPENKHLGFVFSGRQQIGGKWSAQSDAQYTRSKRLGYSTNAPRQRRAEQPNEIDRLNAAVSVVYQPFGDWDFSLDGIVSREDITFGVRMFNSVTGAPIAAEFVTQNQMEDQWSVGAKASGTLFDMPAGRAGLALGLARRAEDYFRKVPLTASLEAADRKVDSAFAEFYIPLVGTANAMRGVRRLELSLAGRYDDYSDFGDTVNPKVGVSWAPSEQWELRTSYSTSFRAPAAGRELRDSQMGADTLVPVYSFIAPDGVGTVAGVGLLGSRTLQPEESQNWSFGFTFRPAGIKGLKITAGYYDIAYINRIVIPSFNAGALSDPALQVFIQQYASPAELQAAVEAIVEGPINWLDATGPIFAGGAFGPNPQNLALFTYDTRWTNAGSVDISGFDFMVDYGFAWRGNRLQLGLNASHIAQIDTRFTPAAPAIDLVDTVTNPADWRVRATTAWSRGRLDGSLALNYTDGYINNAGAIDVDVRAYTTVDASLRIDLGRAGAERNSLSMSIGATNLLDEGPPYVVNRGAFYDGANASPLGRLVWIDVSKRW